MAEPKPKKKPVQSKTRTKAGPFGAGGLINDPEAVRFSNDFCRILADQLVSTYDSCKIYKSYWDSRPNLTTLFPDLASEIVQDGYQSDGRHPVSGQVVTALYNQATAIIAWYETVVGGKTRIDWFRSISVNARPRF